MAVTADWPNHIFHVPRADMTLIQSTPTEIRECNINWLRLQIMALEDDAVAMTFPTVFRHFPEVTLGSLTFAKVIEMLAPYTITFEDGQYAVNLTGANSNFGDRVNVNQVSVRSQNSAGMTSSAAMEFSSFSGAVWVNIHSSTVGTLYPAGSAMAPVNNLTDAKLIAEERGIMTIKIMSSMTIADVDFRGYTITAINPMNTLLTIDPSAELDDAVIHGVSITGTLDNQVMLERCFISGLEYFNGLVYNCSMDHNPVKIRGTSLASFYDCKGDSPLDQLIEFDCDGSSAPLTIRNFSGCAKITHRNVDATSCINFSGELVLDATCTTGQFDVSGNGDLTDNTTGDAFVIKRKLTHPDEIADRVWNYLIEAGISAEEVMRIQAAALAGKASGAGTGTMRFKGLDGATDRIVSTVDGTGNRTAVVVDGG